jgi:hypothetical protein
VSAKDGGSQKAVDSLRGASLDDGTWFGVCRSQRSAAV